MNVYQIVFLMLIVLPPIVSFLIDDLNVWQIYLVELGFIMFLLVFALLGTV